MYVDSQTKMIGDDFEIIRMHWAEYTDDKTLIYMI